MKNSFLVFCNILVICFCLISFQVNAQQKAKKKSVVAKTLIDIVGVWKYREIKPNNTIGNNLNQFHERLTGTQYQFNKDGTFMVSSVGFRSMGKYTFNRKSKTILLNRNDGTLDKMNIKFLSNNEMRFSFPKGEIVIVR